MSKKRRWTAFALAVSLALGALAPATALATRGNPLDTVDDPPLPPLEYGDPEPGSGGIVKWGDFAIWKDMLLVSMRIRFGLPIEPVRAAKAIELSAPIRVNRGETK